MFNSHERCLLGFLMLNQEITQSPLLFIFAVHIQISTLYQYHCKYCVHLFIWIIWLVA